VSLTIGAASKARGRRPVYARGKPRQPPAAERSSSGRCFRNRPRAVDVGSTAKGHASLSSARGPSCGPRWRCRGRPTPPPSGAIWTRSATRRSGCGQGLPPDQALYRQTSLVEWSAQSPRWRNATIDRQGRANNALRRNAGSVIFCVCFVTTSLQPRTYAGVGSWINLCRGANLCPHDPQRSASLDPKI